MVRAFVAIDLPESIKQKVYDSQNALKQCNVRLKFVDPAGFHITLKFLGEVEPSSIDPIIHALQSLSQDPFTITVGPITWNNPKRPRVIWCTIRDGGECASLHHRIEDLLAPLGIPRENRPFATHATIARVREGTQPPDMQQIVRQVRALPQADIGSCEVTGIKLKKSTLTPQGPIYEDLAEVAF
jgi:RNA 2',3'-cyclic 3'-phosphodiesterase